MRKNRFKRFLVTSISCAMAVGMMTGCGKSEEKGTEAEKESGKQTEEVATSDPEAVEIEEESGIDSWTAFDDTVNIKVAVYDRGTQGIDPVTDNGYTKYVQQEFGDKYNVNLEFVPITRSDVMTDYALLAASEDLPTILMEYDYPKVVQWANDGYLQPIDFTEFAKVAPTYYQRMVDLNQLMYTDVNGETFFCLAERPYYNLNYTYPTLVRMDWLRQVGYDAVPESYAEYIEAMEKIKEAGICEHPIPGGDGLGAMISVSSTCNTAGWDFRDFPITEQDWAKYSSLSCPALPYEATRKMLKRYNAEYNAGLWNPEYSITDNETAKANFINGNQYSYAGYMTASVDWLDSFYAANPDAELAVQSPFSVEEAGVVDGAQKRSDNPYGMTIGFGNKATPEQLKAAWMYMEWCTLNIEELQSHADDWNNFNNSKDFWCVTIESVKRDSLEESIKSITPQGIPQDLESELVAYAEKLQKIADAGRNYTDPAFSISLESEAEYAESLLSLYVVDFDKLVSCSPEEFDALYDQLVEEYLAAGYQEVIDERLAAYEKGQSTPFPLQ